MQLQKYIFALIFRIRYNNRETTLFEVNVRFFKSWFVLSYRMMQTVLRMMSYLMTRAINGNKISPVLLAGPQRGTPRPLSVNHIVLCVFPL